MPGRDVLREVAQRIDLNEEERQEHKTGGAKWVVALGFHSGDAATAGWLVKRDDEWWITEAGIAALDTYPTPEEFISEVNRRYREVFRSRKQARKKYDGSLSTLANALDLVPAGSWTSYDDLAELVEGSPDEIAHLLADELIPNSHRVLPPDGQIPPVRYQHASYRRTNLRDRLATEGIEFDQGVARQDQRITSDLLRERLAEAVEPEPAPRRAWLVRGSNVDGTDVVPEWLAEGFVSVAASQLPDVGPAKALQPATLHRIVEEGYRHKNYSVREKLFAEFWAFLSLMREGDHLVTVHRGNVYLGLIDGEPYFVESLERRSNLRRAVRWLNPRQPLDLAELPRPLASLTQSQDDVIDLTGARDALDRLYAPLLTEEPAPAPVAAAQLAPITTTLADDLLIDEVGWLEDLAELLAERRQVILYGPPGTGKTYLARKLGMYLTEPHAVQLVQFHPSYTYEDFFEGFRPRSTVDGRLEFELRPGAFRSLAEEAREHLSTAYILIIDEINRGNLAKIFGELYFLLEYRDQRIRLQYSQEDFTLPDNLYVIGTMNTADRSIALVDAAMRRRFAFVEMHPQKPPVAGLLRRWLARRGIESDAGDLLDALNARLSDADYAIGPSYLMRESIYAKPDGLDRVWRTDILPLLVEHHYTRDVDVEREYGLASLRASRPPETAQP
jgi:5-methylcytosine-specific restriction protein B